MFAFKLQHIIFLCFAVVFSFFSSLCLLSHVTLTSYGMTYVTIAFGRVVTVEGRQKSKAPDSSWRSSSAKFSKPWARSFKTKSKRRLLLCVPSSKNTSTFSFCSILDQSCRCPAGVTVTPLIAVDRVQSKRFCASFSLFLMQDQINACWYRYTMLFSS